MLLSRLFRKIVPSAPSDQIYDEATIEDRMIENQKINERLSDVAATNEKSDANLRAGIDHIKFSSRQRHDVMAELVRGMKTGR
jgi:hypothetical protein